jgi:hypothetical protein
MKNGTAHSSEKAETGRYMNPPTIPANMICLFFTTFLNIDKKDFWIPLVAGIFIMVQE